MKEFSKTDAHDLLAAQIDLDNAISEIVRGSTRERIENVAAAIERLIEVKITIALQQHIKKY